MKLWECILENAQKKKRKKEKFSQTERLFEKECYIVLEKIKKVIEDDTLSDKECFYKIENIRLII